MSSIQYIRHASIDKKKWDTCIDKSLNGLIYTYSWYLDAAAKNWDALVLDDYDAVMPLTWNKKYGIYYLYQPWFCASLGVFSIRSIDALLLDNFLHQIPKHFRYWDFYLNYGNPTAKSEFILTERTNYTLSLRSSYETISSGYRNNLKRNIVNAINNGLFVLNSIDLQDILALAKKTMQRVSPITNKEITWFNKIFESARANQNAETWGVYSKNNELLASAVFLFSHERWYYILVGNHPNGRTTGASHYLIDRFIAGHATTTAILDFEGSDIDSLAFFYSSYGATEEKYAAVKINKLPTLFKWIKQ
jgi:hypothetical protein